MGGPLKGTVQFFSRIPTIAFVLSLRLVFHLEAARRRASALLSRSKSFNSLAPGNGVRRYKVAKPQLVFLVLPQLLSAASVVRLHSPAPNFPLNKFIASLSSSSTVRLDS
jgi:hypothetical protein